MRPTLVAIGLDSADPRLLEDWAAEGCLPAIARLRDEGAYAALRGPDLYLSEQAWTLVMTGCDAARTGYWTRWKFDPRTYEIRDVGAYEFEEYPAFYELCGESRSAIFDVPQARLSENVRGVQVLAWGARSARTESGSSPTSLLGELVRRYGPHPAFDRDHASHWNPVAMAWLERALHTGIGRRSAICRDLLRRERWDFFFTTFGETHSAGHFFWHLSQPHPLRGGKGNGADDPLLRVFQAVDRAIGEIVAERPDASVLLFSPEGMAANSVDLPSTVFLPELLYRFSFGGALGMLGEDGGGSRNGVPRPVRRPKALGWHREVYARRADRHPLRRRLRRWLPIEVSHWWEGRSSPGPGPEYPNHAGALFHQPGMWYRPLWPRMKAFALPSISHGYVRLNVRGREAHGVVSPADFDSVCEELSALFRALRDPRTGKPVVTEVVRTRELATDAGRDVPDPDLVVFYESEPADVVDSPRFGRIGPVPYARTGGHVNRGFAILRAPGYAPGSILPSSQVRDLAATMLDLLGAPLPTYMDGTPLGSGIAALARGATSPAEPSR